jgi:LPXTG-motif cell wall-anchored protein
MKKLLSLLVVISLVLSCAFSASAAVTPSDVLDPTIQAAVDAFADMENALEDGDLELLAKGLEDISVITENLTEDQLVKWAEYVEAEIGLERFVEVAISAGMILGAVECYHAYVEDKNATSAYGFVSVYEELKEMGYDLNQFVPEAETAYEEAKANYLPEEGVLSVLDAYTELIFALEWQVYDEDFMAACEGFEAVLDTFNALSQDELEELAVLLEVESADEVFSLIVNDWVRANMIMMLGDAYDAYFEESTVETAQAFVEAYEVVFKDTTGVVTEEDLEVYYGFFSDIDDVYAEAKALIDDGDEIQKEEKPEMTPVTESDVATKDEDLPKTGESSTLVIAFLVIVVAFVGIVVTMRKKK